jgi:hypothetical protein
MARKLKSRTTMRWDDSTSRQCVTIRKLANALYLGSFHLLESCWKNPRRADEILEA